MRTRTIGLALLATALAATLAIGLPDAYAARFIVKFKPVAEKKATSKDQRIAKLAVASETPLRRVRDMALGAEVIAADGVGEGAAADRIAARLADSPDVEYAQVDHRVVALAAYPVNDEFLSAQGYLFNSPTAIDAFDAWTVTHGSAATVVAVVDSGYRPHAGMLGRFLPGYDMISDPAMANDGDGRDPDATDPGDWLTQAMLTGEFANCKAADSTWHGTGVAGVIAANTDDMIWTAGIDWHAMILPVRVLGRCGGDDSDVIDGVAWAAGLSVPGVPDNPHPAQIINLSLGSVDSESCPPAYTELFAAAYLNGVRAIVAAAGNSSADVSTHSPANCAGAIAVASTTTTGKLASYSNFGTGITVSAPGGSFSFFQPGIMVLSNAGQTVPTTDSYAFRGGTSFAAPMVSGTISLMLAVNPSLGPAAIVSILTSTASPFVSLSDCTTSLCGAGIVNAGAAVRAAAAVPLPNYEGLWWAFPAGSESGWGLNIAHQGSTIFATWFTYDTSGRAWWLSMTGNENAPDVFSGTLVETHGPAFSATPFDPLLVTRTEVGSGVIAFIDADDALFSYTVNGVAQVKAIVREAFGPLPVCTFGGLADLRQATNYQDLWWAAPAGSESGWGINLTHEGSAIFGTWFTYDVDGTPLWLSVTATPSGSTLTPQGAPAVWSGQLVRTAGPAFSAAPFDPHLVTRSVVGTATFTFSDGANGTFGYTVNGIGPAPVTQSKAFTREVFVAPGTVCR